jgi:hypothetical protein
VSTSRRAPRPRRCSNHAAGVVATEAPARTKATEITTVEGIVLQRERAAGARRPPARRCRAPPARSSGPARPSRLVALAPGAAFRRELPLVERAQLGERGGLAGGLVVADARDAREAEREAGGYVGLRWISLYSTSTTTSGRTRTV